MDGRRAREIRNSYPKVFQFKKEGWDQGTYMDAGDCLEALIDSLNECAPEGLFFGSHPGDGSDFGFWPIESDETPTGRTVCHEPKLQNISIRTGAEVQRSLFSTPTVSTVDYSGVELRLASMLRERKEEEGE